MLVVETVVRIRREYAGGKPIKEIARDLRLSRKVDDTRNVALWLLREKDVALVEVTPRT